MPFELVSAIQHAGAINAWHENLRPEDVPPKWMWHLDEELVEHFRRLNNRDDDDEEPSGPVAHNDLARGRGANER